MSGASNFVEGVDLSFAIILGISLFFLVGITAVMIYFVVKYRRSKNPKASNIHGNNKLEIIWTVIPTILVLIMFYFGWIGYKPMREVPEGAIPVKVYGQMWAWSYEYENGKVSDKLVVPINQPVKLDLISRDVLHSFYIPAFRIKEDVVPGRDNYMWFIAEEEGSYNVFCAEYCGDRHAYMLSTVEVIPEDEYLAWLETSDAPAGEHPGLTILKQNACISCHSLDGSALIGPTFKGIYGRKEVVIEGEQEYEISVDEEYIRKSIYEPNAQLVKGYNKGLMISYTEQIDEEAMNQVIDYLKTLK
jgi:cytochrome c oxidase subunit 2